MFVKHYHKTFIDKCRVAKKKECDNYAKFNAAFIMFHFLLNIESIQATHKQMALWLKFTNYTINDSKIKRNCQK